MKLPLIAGNWKMNKNTVEAAVLSQNISYGFERHDNAIEVVLCPPFIDIKTVRTVLEFDKSRIMLGAQDVYWEDEGAYTGAISPLMLKSEGVQYCIVGHSERREYFGETDEMVSRKAKALLAHDLTPIICVGEGLAKREEGDQAAIDFVSEQVGAALQLLDLAEISRIVVAYEPIWAIGTGRTATPEAAQEMCASIRACLAARIGADAAEGIRILYGGSMKPENAAFFAPMPDINGGLIGGASLDAKDFIDIVEAFR